MRRLLRPFGLVLVALLLLQWGGAAAACLAGAGHGGRWPAGAICHTDTGGAPADTPGHDGGMQCPLCAPLPAGLLPVAVVVTGSSVVAPAPFVVAGVLPAVAVPARRAPQQPRAPPAFA